MTESNKLVIKINYSGEKRNIKPIYNPEMVTEWHYQRVFFAVLLVLVIILSAVYFFNSHNTVATNKIVKNMGGNEPPDKVVKLRAKIPVITPDLIKQDAAELIQPVINISREVEKDKINVADRSKLEGRTDQRIVRVLLTTELNNHEPVDQVYSPLITRKDEAIGIYFFTEIINMKGQALYHHWLREGKTIYKREINIMDNRWRAATRKLIPYASAGNWHVKLVNAQGVILNEIQFQVIQQ